MNGLMPALVAVLLAEFGPRATMLWQARGRELRIFTVFALVTSASIAGAVVDAQLTGWADALMIGVALVFAGIGQLQRVKDGTGIVRALWTFWGGGTVLLVFALATRFGAVSVGVGALAGLAAAIMLSLLDLPLRWPRRIAAVALMIAGSIAIVSGLRLV